MCNKDLGQPNPMEPIPRHQCMIYEGAPSRQLAALAAVVRDKLNRNIRCFYLNSPHMVAGMRSYLAAAGVDVERATREGQLQLSSIQSHLVDGRFDPRTMIRTLEAAVHTALGDGYAGLWASGDMTWELGPEQDFSTLLAYEWELEKLLRQHPQLSGICQYHADTLPRTVLRQALISHPAIFESATLARINPQFLEGERFTAAALGNPDLDAALQQILC